MNKVHIELEATSLRSGKWAVRAFDVSVPTQYVEAWSEAEAIRVAKRNLERRASRAGYEVTQ